MSNTEFVSKAVMVRVANDLETDLLPDNAVWTNRVHIRSQTSNNLYVVAQRKTDGVWGCGCRGWIRHRNCKHLTAMMPVLLAAKKTVAAIPAPKKGRR